MGGTVEVMIPRVFADAVMTAVAMLSHTELESDLAVVSLSEFVVELGRGRAG